MSEELKELRSIHITLRQLLAVLEARSAKQPKATEHEAIAALLVVGPSMTKISKLTGRNRTALYRMKTFMTLYRKAQGPVRKPRKGFRTTEGLEAIDDSPDDE